VDTIGERLREERLRNGWSQKDLARESKINVDTISGIETGQHEPRPSTLTKLAKALSIEVRDLFAEPALAGKAEAGAEPPAYEYAGGQRITREFLRAQGIEANDSEILVLNQYFQLHEQPPAELGIIVHVEKEGEPVDHERVRGILIVLLAKNLLGKEEVEAASRKVYAELVSTA